MARTRTNVSPARASGCARRCLAPPGSARCSCLAWAKAPAEDIRRSAEALLRDQRQDGGWAQLATLETDAYATGQALVALQPAGHAAPTPHYPPPARHP